MEGFEEKWRGCTENDWTEWIEARLLTVVYYDYKELCVVIALVFIYYTVYKHNVHLNYEL